MPSIKMHERSGWKNARNATLSGSVGPFRGREGRPSPGATDLAPSWATSNFGRTDLRRTTNNFFLAYVLNKHHAYHDPSEIDFARPTQASSVQHNCERPLLQEVFRCGRRFRIDPHRPHSLVRGRGQRKKTQGSRTTSEISQIAQRRCAQKADAAARGTGTRPMAGDGGTRAATGTTGEISGEERRGSRQTSTQVGGSSKPSTHWAILPYPCPLSH